VIDARAARSLDQRKEQSIETTFKIYLITDRKLAAKRGGLIAMTAAALSAAPPNTVAVQLREKDLEAGELVALGRELRTLCSRHHARLLVNDRIDVAIAAHADGVHLPADSFAVADARALIGNGGLVGVSTHDDVEVIGAARAGADFVVYGPVFDPLSKTSYTIARGAAGLIAAGRAASIPVFALGGITADRVRELGIAFAIGKALGLSTHPAGIAVIGSIYDAPDPAAAMHELLSALASW
jgi:thiamine-phosphate pyrophosphorylase